jgi:hypothetical protein
MDTCPQTPVRNTKRSEPPSIKEERQAKIAKRPIQTIQPIRMKTVEQLRVTPKVQISFDEC